MTTEPPPAPGRGSAWLSAIDAGFLLRTLPFFALIVLAATLSYRYHALLQEQRSRVDHTYEVVTRLESTLVAIIDAETGQRGFVITGDERYLQPYRNAIAAEPAALADLRTLLADSPEQQARLDALHRLVTIKFGELDETLVARRTDGAEAARLLVVRDRGRATMDDLRATIGTMKAHELDLLGRRGDALHVTERRLLTTTLVCATLSLIARLGLAWQARRRRPADRPTRDRA